MKRIRSIFSLWSVIVLLVAVVTVQMAAAKDFFSDLNYHGTHIEQADPADSDSEDAKHLGFHLDFHFIPPPLFQLFLAVFSCSQLVFPPFPVYKFVFPTEFCGRAPPA